VGPRAGLNATEMRKKYLAPKENRTPVPQLSTPYPVDIPTELSWLSVNGTQHFSRWTAAIMFSL
jgi:hypothetical protein